MNRGRHADLKPEVINPLLSQSTAAAPASSTNPRQSQPEGGRRFTSQTGQHHHKTLGQTRPHPADPYKSAILRNSSRPLSLSQALVLSSFPAALAEHSAQVRIVEGSARIKSISDLSEVVKAWIQLA